jgi:hypothetical protein
VQLAEARDYAGDAHRDVWDFAVEIAGLTALGLTVSDLRWLVSKGYVEHACEVTKPDDPVRRFRPGSNLTFVKETCFVLTQGGVSLLQGAGAACAILHLGGGGVQGPLSPVAPASPVPAATPRWDHQRRILSVGGRVVKQFRVPSPNQEAVLAAFQREGWPAYIGDPLPASGGPQGKIRLHDTIKCLNGRQEERLIRFRGNGTGLGVLWEMLDAQEIDSLPPGDGLSRAAA